MSEEQRTYGTLKFYQLDARNVRTYCEQLRHYVKQGEYWEMSDVEPHVAIRLKQLFPKVPKGSVAPFYFPHDLGHAADLDWFLQRYPMKITRGDRRRLSLKKNAFEKRQNDMESILLPDSELPPVMGLKEGEEVRHYQMQAIEILRRRGSLMLGDEGGLGKTYTAAGFLCSEQAALPAAVVVEPHNQQQWYDKLTSFTNLRVHMINRASPYSLPEADVYLYRYSQVGKWADIFGTGFFKSVTYDEPQSLRTGIDTIKGQSCSVLSKNTDFQLGLTATPIYNYGDEMWNVMQFIDDQVLGSSHDFHREWCKPTGQRWSVADPIALGTYLREQYALVRRLKPDVGLELPDVSRIPEYVETDQKAVKSVENLAKQLALKATIGSFVERGQATRELDIMMRQATGVSKAHAVAQFVRMLVEAGEPVLLVGWHREVYDIWNRELDDLKPAMNTGSESHSKKVKERQRFLDGDTKVLMMSLRSVAGIDGLQHICSTVVFGELDWSPGIHQQIIWRVDREGQTLPVTAFFLVCNEGSDPPMMEVNGIKASEATQIVDPHLGVQATKSDRSNLKRLVERYLDAKNRRALSDNDDEAYVQETDIIEVA